MTNSGDPTAPPIPVGPGPDGQTPGSVSSSTGDPEAAARRARGATLILAAFAAAKRRGRDDWQRMTVAVLKNRILAVDPKFQQEDWGARTMVDFVGEFADLVTLDQTPKPPIVQLHDDRVSQVPDEVQSAVAPSASGPSSDWLIRPDLWQAVTDYRSGCRYVWDGSTAVAIPADADPDDPGPQLPTVDRDELRGWRSEFIDEQSGSGLTSGVSEMLTSWAEMKLPGRALPGRLRVRWLTLRKGRVRDLLVEWFADHNIEPPADLVETAPPRDDGSRTETDQLRALVIRSVNGMTRGELEALQLPATALLRIVK